MASKNLWAIINAIQAYVMQPGGQARIKPIPAVKRPRDSIADVCRQNWQGYQIHKIIGSART